MKNGKEVAISKDADLSISMAYVLADMLDGAMKDVFSEVEKAGFRLNHEFAMYSKGATNNMRKFNQTVRQCSTREQEALGYDSDRYMAFMWLLIDRCGKDEDTFRKIYDEVKANYDSKLGLQSKLERNEKIAFDM